MARPKSFDRDQVLDRAVEAFWAGGYEATSIAELERVTGVGRQSLYDTFGDKHRLFVEALDRYARRNAAMLGESDAAAGLAGLRAYFANVVAFLSPGGPRRACLIANTILELGARDPEAATVCRRNQETVHATLRRALDVAVERGEVAADLDVDATARMLVAQVYGLSLLAKMGADAEELRQGADALLDRLTV